MMVDVDEQLGSLRWSRACILCSSLKVEGKGVKIELLKQGSVLTSIILVSNDLIILGCPDVNLQQPSMEFYTMN